MGGLFQLSGERGRDFPKAGGSVLTLWSFMVGLGAVMALVGVLFSS